MTDFANLEIRVTAKGIENARKAVRGIDAEINKAGKSLQTQKMDRGFNNAAQSAMRLKTVVTGLVTGVAVQNIIKFTDAWTNAGNRLRVVTTNTQDFKKAQDDLLAASNKTRSDFGATAELYSKLSRSTQEMGLSHKELLGITTTINKAFSASGTTAAEAAGSIRQLGQALASGALRGEEFNSISEGAPAIMRAITQETGMTIGALRDFAAEGKITAELVVRSLKNAAESIDKDFGATVATFGQKINVVKNNAAEFFGTMEEATGIVAGVGDAMVLASKNLDVMATSVIALGGAVTGKLIPALSAIAGPAALAAAGITGAIMAWRNFNEELKAERTETEVASILGVGDLSALDFRISETVEKIKAARAEIELFGGNANNKQLNDIFLLEEELERQKDVRATVLEQMKQMTEASGVEAEAQGVLAESIDKTNAKMSTLAKNAADYMGELTDAMGSVTFADELSTLAEAYNLDQDQFTFLEEHGQRIMQSSPEIAVGLLGWAAAIEGLGRESKQAFGFVEEFDTRLRESSIIGFSTEFDTRLPGKDANFPAQDPNVIAKREQIAAAKEAAIKHAEDIDRAYDNMMENIQRGWGNTIYTMLSEGELEFSSFWDTIKDGFFKMVAEMASADLMAAIFGYGQGGNLAGVLSNIAGGGGILGQVSNAVGLSGPLSTVAGWLGGSTAAATTGVSPLAAAFAANFPGAGVAGAAGSAAAGTAAGTAAGGAGIFAGLKGAGSSLMSGASALLTNPWTYALGALAMGAANDWWSDPDGYTRSNAGMLVGPTPGADPSQTFNVNPFASGFAPTGFVRRGTQSDANAVIDQFRAVDKMAVDYINQLGGSINMSNATLAGVGEDGIWGTSGTFLGTGGKTQNMDAQFLSFGKQVLKHGGLPSDLMAKIQGAGSAEEVKRILDQAVAEKNAKEAASGSKSTSKTKSSTSTSSVTDAVSTSEVISAIRDVETAIYAVGTGTGGEKKTSSSTTTAAEDAVVDALDANAQNIMDNTSAFEADMQEANQLNAQISKILSNPSVSGFGDLTELQRQYGEIMARWDTNATSSELYTEAFNKGYTDFVAAFTGILGEESLTKNAFRTLFDDAEDPFAIAQAAADFKNLRFSPASLGESAIESLAQNPYADLIKDALAGIGITVEDIMHYQQNQNDLKTDLETAAQLQAQISAITRDPSVSGMNMLQDLMKRFTDIMDRWDIDGMPPERA